MKGEETGSTPGLSTRAVHAGGMDAVPQAPVVTPIVASSTFYNEIEPEGEVHYTRYGTNPNHRVLAAKLAALEGAESAIALGSGMAATALTILAHCGAGDHIVAARALYGGTATLLSHELPRLGIDVTFIDRDSQWAESIRPTTRLLFVEIPVNPTLRVPDIRPLARLARERGIPLAVDATFATPINFRPLEHGATVVIHSATKYLGGHSDLIAGAVAGPADLVEAVRSKLKSFGPALDPHAAWLLERGLKTLAVRVRQHNANALELARWLEDSPAVARVHYPGLASHPDHDTVRGLFDGFGGMVGFVVRGGDAAARRVLSRLRLHRIAPSLGGVESLVSMPRYTSHRDFEPAQRHALGIDDGFIRVSVGIEDVADLRADLAGALEPEAA